MIHGWLILSVSLLKTVFIWLFTLSVCHSWTLAAPRPRGRGVCGLCVVCYDLKSLLWTIFHPSPSLNTVKRAETVFQESPCVVLQIEKYLDIHKLRFEQTFSTLLSLQRMCGNSLHCINWGKKIWLVIAKEVDSSKVIHKTGRLVVWALFTLLKCRWATQTRLFTVGCSIHTGQAPGRSWFLNLSLMTNLLT